MVVLTWVGRWVLKGAEPEVSDRFPRFFAWVAFDAYSMRWGACPYLAS